MKQLRLIEPDHLSGMWMPGYCLTHLPGTQAILRQPLEIQSEGLTITLNLRLARRLKNFFPGEIQTAAVVSNIHHALLREELTDSERNGLIDAAAVCDWRFAARRGASQTEKPNLHGPVTGVGIFVM